MDPRSEDEATYGGVRWLAVNGRMGWCHVWSDGIVLPALIGFDDDDGKDEDDDSEDDDNDDGKDEEDEDAKSKNPRIKELSNEAALRRRQRNEARKARDDALAEVGTLKKEVNDLKEQLKEGGSDEKLKTRVTELEAQVKTIGDERDETKRKLEEAEKNLKGHSVKDQVAAAMKTLKVKDSDKFVRFTLQESGMLEVDEDGEVEDLTKNLKSLIRKGDLSVIGDDDEEDDSNEDKGAASGASRSSGKSFNRKKKTDGLDRKTLEAKFPAIRR